MKNFSLLLLRTFRHHNGTIIFFSLSTVFIVCNLSSHWAHQDERSFEIYVVEWSLLTLTMHPCVNVHLMIILLCSIAWILFSFAFECIDDLSSSPSYFYKSSQLDLSRLLPLVWKAHLNWYFCEKINISLEKNLIYIPWALSLPMCVHTQFWKAIKNIRKLFFHFYLLSAAYNVQPYIHRWKEFQSFFISIHFTHTCDSLTLLTHFLQHPKMQKKYIKLLWVSLTLHWCFYCSFAIALYPHLTFIRSIFIYLFFAPHGISRSKKWYRKLRK